ncbi:hypothetical protein H5410_061555 [Solanum commersonii]|uniref:Uncharacterized protein n=1 Tax=Solanum commersonii TaxID=4109 RepID=A0A9J5W861_SOLCO|nr:hypothetical protein H5410_061555 [Solanum commersonii]
MKVWPPLFLATASNFTAITTPVASEQKAPSGEANALRTTGGTTSQLPNTDLVVNVQTSYSSFSRNVERSYNVFCRIQGRQPSQILKLLLIGKTPAIKEDIKSNHEGKSPAIKEDNKSNFEDASPE